MQRGKLTLSRRPGESIEIGADITITVMSVRGNTVKVLIEAPRNVGVLRSEVVDAIAREKGGTTGCDRKTPVRTT